MTLNRSLLFLIAALICYLIALLLATDWLIDDGNYPAFIAAGSAAFVAAHIPVRTP